MKTKPRKLRQKKSKLLKILIPAANVVVIIGIWFAKNGLSRTGAQLDVDNDDFVLEAAELDLEHLKSYDLPIMIDFGSDSCIPHKEMAPVLAEVNDERRAR